MRLLNDSAKVGFPGVPFRWMCEFLRPSRVLNEWLLLLLLLPASGSRGARSLLLDEAVGAGCGMSVYG